MLYSHDTIALFCSHGMNEETNSTDPQRALLVVSFAVVVGNHKSDSFFSATVQKPYWVTKYTPNNHTLNA